MIYLTKIETTKLVEKKELVSENIKKEAVTSKEKLVPARLEFARKTSNYPEGIIKFI